MPLYKIATETINSKTEFPLQLVGATVSGSFARKIDKMNILDTVSKEERLSYNIGNPKVIQELLHMLKPTETDSNAIVIGVIYRLLMVTIWFYWFTCIDSGGVSLINSLVGFGSDFIAVLTVPHGVND